MSKVYKVGDVFYDKGLNCYVKAVASDSKDCDRDKCALHTSDCITTIDNCVGMRFVKVAAPKYHSAVKEPKEYEWKNKTYIESPADDANSCVGCALSEENCFGFPCNCVNEKVIFIEKPRETLENVMAKGERMANSIMGFNSYVPFSPEKELNARETFLKIAKEHREYIRRMESNESHRFIVSLLENDMLEPSTNPKIHDSIESAEKEAERLCRLHNQEFVVLKVTASFKPQQPKKEVFA